MLRVMLNKWWFVLAEPDCKSTCKGSNSKISRYLASPLQDWLGREVFFLEIRVYSRKYYTGIKLPDPVKGQGGRQLSVVTGDQMIGPPLKRGLPWQPGKGNAKALRRQVWWAIFLCHSTIWLWWKVWENPQRTSFLSFLLMWACTAALITPRCLPRQAWGEPRGPRKAPSTPWLEDFNILVYPS